MHSYHDLLPLHYTVFYRHLGQNRGCVLNAKNNISNYFCIFFFLTVVEMINDVLKTTRNKHKKCNRLNREVYRTPHML